MGGLFVRLVTVQSSRLHSNERAGHLGNGGTECEMLVCIQMDAVDPTGGCHRAGIKFEAGAANNNATPR